MSRSLRISVPSAKTDTMLKTGGDRPILTDLLFFYERGRGEYERMDRLAADSGAALSAGAGLCRAASEPPLAPRNPAHRTAPVLSDPGGRSPVPGEKRWQFRVRLHPSRQQ